MTRCWFSWATVRRLRTVTVYVAVVSAGMFPAAGSALSLGTRALLNLSGFTIASPIVGAPEANTF
jgi:hypothetical protein